MRKFVLALGMVAVASPALAISRYNSMSYSCADLQAIVQQDGQAIFHYPSKMTGIGLYERLVSNKTTCSNSQMMHRMTIPTKDNPRCRVLTCRWGNDLRP